MRQRCVGRHGLDVGQKRPSSLLQAFKGEQVRTAVMALRRRAIAGVGSGPSQRSNPVRAMRLRARQATRGVPARLFCWKQQLMPRTSNDAHGGRTTRWEGRVRARRAAARGSGCMEREEDGRRIVLLWPVRHRPPVHPIRPAAGAGLQREPRRLAVCGHAPGPQRGEHAALPVRATGEHRPGSTLVAVWSQERKDFAADERFRLRRDANDLLRAPGTNALLIKVSYRLNR